MAGSTTPTGTGQQAVPLVSVVVPTYQHAGFIATCLDSILGQETTFPIEILVGEDESTDGTREICQRYAAEHPDQIRLFLNSRKDVLYIKGLATGRANLCKLMAAAKGTYIALCEGDDYWTDPLKLQKQVDTMSKHALMAACAHDVEFIDDRTKTIASLPFKHTSPGAVNLKDIAPRRCYHTASLLFRRQALETSWWPEVSKKYLSADKAIALALYQAGGIYFLPDRMAIYRRHTGGASTSPRLDLYMRSDIGLYTELALRFNGQEQSYLDECAIYYRLKRAQFRLGRVPLPKAFIEHLGLLRYVGQSAFLTWANYKKALGIVFRSALVNFRRSSSTMPSSNG